MNALSVEAPETVVEPEPAAQEAVPQPDELDRLEPPSADVTLESGSVVVVQPLKSRQFFKLLRIITRGGANVLHTWRLSSNMPQEEFLQNLLALVLFAIPEAEDETMAFVLSVVLPKDFEKLATPQLRQEALLRLEAELDNPSLDDLLSIVTTLVQREATDLQALGKRLSGLMGVAEKTGQLNQKTETSS